jgi:hypothetical protein
VPGCRSARGLEIHHLVHRSNGGGHDASNLALLCGSCHLAHHRGALAISGTAEKLAVRRPGDKEQILGIRSPLPLTAEAIDAHVGADQGEPRRAVPPGPPSERVLDSADASAHVGASKLDAAILRTQAKAALTGLGWRPAIAHAAVAAAMAQAGEVTLERLIFESLRRCPVSRA